MALVGQAVSEKKIFEIVDGRTTDGRTPDHGHPISSPCEPNGSGELIILHILLSQVMGKLTFGICKNKGADQLNGTVFITGIVQCHYFLNLKLSASSQLLFLHSLICVRASCWFSNQECWFSHENA